MTIPATHGEVQRCFNDILNQIWFWGNWSSGDLDASPKSHDIYFFQDSKNGFSAILKNNHGSTSLVISDSCGGEWKALIDQVDHMPFHERSNDFKILARHTRVKASKDLPGDLPTLESIRKKITNTLLSSPTGPEEDTQLGTIYERPVRNWLNAHSDRQTAQYEIRVGANRGESSQHIYDQYEVVATPSGCHSGRIDYTIEFYTRFEELPVDTLSFHVQL